MKEIDLTDEQSEQLLEFIKNNLRRYEQDEFWDGYRCGFCRGTDDHPSKPGEVAHKDKCLGKEIQAQLEHQ